MKIFFSSLLIILLLTVESSVQVSIIFDRSSAWWSPWIYKVGPLSIADMMIMAIALYTLIHIVLRIKIRILPSIYLELCLLAGVYLLIGLMYNFFVYTLWKTFLYDVKVVLYLAIPYLFLYFCVNDRIKMWFTPLRILIMSAVANMIDFSIVTIWRGSDYPALLGLPTIPPLVTIVVGIIGLIYAKKTSHKFLFLLFLLIDIVFNVNRLSVGTMFDDISVLSLVFLVKSRLKFLGRFLLVLFAILLFNLTSIVIIYHAEHIPLVKHKSGGAVTRVFQFENALLNAKENFPFIIGKGLGSTWFEYIPIPKSDIYSIGTSVDPMSKVKFIFNFGPAVLLHKWGVLGTLLLVFFTVRYFYVNEKRLKYLIRLYPGKVPERFLSAVLIISFIYIWKNFSYIGILKTSLFTSLLAFYVEYTLFRAIKETQLLETTI